RSLGSRPHDEIVGGALDQHLLERAQELQRDRGDRADVAGAAAQSALLGRAFQHAGADALARHLQKAEMRYSPHLNAGAIVLEALLQATLGRAVVALLVHV